MKTIKNVLPALLAVAAFTLTACGGDDDDNGGKSSTNAEYVDLGLSVKWATCNLGAKNPWEAGNYYAWGETNPKSSYTLESYKYQDTPQYLDHINDAATVKLGSLWRTPTRDEISELFSDCEWTWTTVNGTQGYRVTGLNGNSIFIPTSGFFFDSNNYYIDWCFFWINYSRDHLGRVLSSCFAGSSGGTRLAISVGDDSYKDGQYGLYSWSGLPIRPVHQ